MSSQTFFQRKNLKKKGHWYVKLNYPFTIKQLLATASNFKSTHNP